jgi:hypothetical protein
MADNYIAITVGSNRVAAKFRNVVDDLERARDQLTNLKQAIDQMTDGSNYTTVENNLGIPTGKGASAYNLITGALSELNADTQLNQLLSWFAALP